MLDTKPSSPTTVPYSSAQDPGTKARRENPLLVIMENYDA